MTKQTHVNTCPLCNTPEYNVVFKKNNYTGKKCTRCELVYITPVLTDANAIYKDDKSSSPSEYYKHLEEYDRITFMNRLELIEKYAAKGNILDIGCSVGNFLSAARQKSWKVTGIEPNPISAKICRNNNFIVEEDFLNQDISEKYCGFFDAIYMGDVIEHISDPINILKLAVNMLKPGAVIMIITPDFSSFITRIFQIKPTEHLLYFTFHSLKYAADLLNLKVELLINTTRIKSLKALQYSTTFSEKYFQKKLLQSLTFLRVEPIVNFFLNLFAKDEILMIIRK